MPQYLYTYLRYHYTTTIPNMIVYYTVPYSISTEWAGDWGVRGVEGQEKRRYIGREGPHNIYYMKGREAKWTNPKLCMGNCLKCPEM